MKKLSFFYLILCLFLFAESVEANTPPSVNAGADFSVVLGTAENLSGEATDDGLPDGSTVTTTWTKVSGPGTATFGDANALATTVSFNAVGSYTLRLSATDSLLTSSDDLIVTVTPMAAPLEPTGLLLSALSSTSIRLTWIDNATNEQGYRLFRTRMKGAEELKTITLPVDSVAYIDTNLVKDTTYCYCIECFESTRLSSPLLCGCAETPQK